MSSTVTNINTYNVQITLNAPSSSTTSFTITITVNSNGCLINGETFTIYPSNDNQCFQIGNLIFQFIPTPSSIIDMSPCALATISQNPSPVVSSNSSIYNGPQINFELDIGMAPCFTLGTNILNNNAYCNYINDYFYTCEYNPNLTVNVTIINKNTSNTNFGGAIGLGGKTGPTGSIKYNLTYQNGSNSITPISNSSGYQYFTFPTITYTKSNTQYTASSTSGGLTMCQYVYPNDSQLNTAPNGLYSASPSLNTYNLFTQTAGSILNSCGEYSEVIAPLIPPNTLVYTYEPCGTIFNPNNSTTISTLSQSGGIYSNTTSCAISQQSSASCNLDCLANCSAIVNNVPT